MMNELLETFLRALRDNDSKIEIAYYTNGLYYVAVLQQGTQLFGEQKVTLDSALVSIARRWAQATKIKTNRDKLVDLLEKLDEQCQNKENARQC